MYVNTSIFCVNKFTVNQTLIFAIRTYAEDRLLPSQKCSGRYSFVAFTGVIIKGQSNEASPQTLQRQIRQKIMNFHFQNLMLSLVTVAIPYYHLHSNCIQLEGKYLS